MARVSYKTQLHRYHVHSVTSSRFGDIITQWRTPRILNIASRILSPRKNARIFARIQHQSRKVTDFFLENNRLQTFSFTKKTIAAILYRLLIAKCLCL